MGKSKAFDAVVYLAVSAGVVALGVWAQMPLIGLAVGLVFFVLALRAAWR